MANDGKKADAAAMDAATADDAETIKLLKDEPVVLVCAPLSGHHATLLRETVRTLLPDHDVYLTDWVDARMVPFANGAFDLDDYVDYVRKFIRHLGPAVHVVSVCQPTVPVLAAVSLMASRGVPFQFGGTSLLIVVVVVMDFIAQLQAHMMSHHYPGLMKKANLLGAGRNGAGS